MLALSSARAQGLPTLGATDASWAGEPDTRWSYGGCLFWIGKCLILWKCGIYRALCLSSVESEVVFISKGATEAKWLIRLCVSCGLADLAKLPVTIYCDNQGAIALSKNNGVSSRTKHIEIRDLFVREAVADGLVDVKYMSTEEMPADMFTKPLTRQRFQKLFPQLGLGNGMTTH